MAAKIQFRRGLEAERTGVVFDAGEPAWASDTKQLWVGDGSTAGGKQVVMWGESPTFAGLATTGAVYAGNPSAVNGSDNALVVGGDIEIARDGVGGTQRHGRIRSVAGSAYSGGLAFDRYFYNGSSYEFGEVLRLDADGAATFGGLVKAGASTDEQFRIGQSATIDSYGYRVGRQATAGANLGLLVFFGPQPGYGGYAFRNAGHGDLVRIENSGTTTFYGVAPGTPGAGQVLIGGGQVKASAAIATVGFVADNGTLNSVSHYAGSAATDEKWWRWQNGSAVGSGVLRLRALNDGLTNGINALTFSRNGISSVTATFGGDIVSGGSFYFGEPSTDGSWRFIKSGANIVVQARDSGSWVDVHTFYFPV